ncbi:MAG: sigma-54-dependent Fis family transcriptional regulator [Desulfuromonadales bacterium]|nr:sigma-54-dependent Fis family transcriptional regulator [Desulfuromonadales bacterium]
MSSTPNPAEAILLIDDEEQWLQRLSFSLEYSGGYDNTLLCQDSRQALDLMERHDVGLVILDLTMPHTRGEVLLESLKADHPDVPVIILSGLNQVATAVECIKKGAYDYFVKTEEQERLLKAIARALEMRQLKQENRQIKEHFLDGELSRPEIFADVITRDRSMLHIFQYLEAIAHSPEPVLVAGESGVGKELIARAVHALRRPSGPFVALNAAGLDDQVFSDTLFGHSRGAFTSADRQRPGLIENAAGGTLFLDEIGDLSAASQIKLLRVLQEGEYLPLGSDEPQKVKAHFLFATNRDLDAMQREGTFRRDLFYRLCAHQVNVPPLRERPHDIPMLLERFLAEASRSLKITTPSYPRELPLLLANYAFPGNVRELRAMVFNALGSHRGGVLSMQTFRQAISKSDQSSETSRAADRVAAVSNPFEPLEALPTLNESAELLVAEAMSRAEGNQSIAAGMLGITRQALNKRLKKINH